MFSGSPAQAGGLKAGDQIISVNGTPTVGLSVEVNVANIKGPAGTNVKLVVRPAAGGADRTLTLTRKNLDVPLTLHRMLHAGKFTVGYVELAEFADGAGKQVHNALQDVIRKGAAWIIFDLRQNGGGLLKEAVSVCSDFLPRGDVVVSTRGLHSPRLCCA